jgi:glucosamine 6-phosphate synthetase-like amidotransferase/phosphosugar isomerase protein
MCGLVGFIGESRDPQLTRNFTTELFIQTESRGVDASGFYCLQEFKNNFVCYHKKPIKSSMFVLEEEYNTLWQQKLNLGIFHCRAASAGVGIPIINENNHPFVSNDFKKALMHNGLIEKSEYELLKNFYEAKTTCDSEILLRVLEQDQNIFDKLSIVFENTEDSAFAVAFTENDDDVRNLYLFRNEQRPLHIIDLYEEIGQLFFFSTPEILFNSLNNIGNPFKSCKIHEIKPYDLFHIKYDLDHEINLSQYSVKLNREFEKQQLEQKKINANKSVWQNKMSNSEFSSIEVMENMANKLIDNILKMQNFYKTNTSNPEVLQEKINIGFQFIRECSKRIEIINKNILS